MLARILSLLLVLAWVAPAAAQSYYVENGGLVVVSTGYGTSDTSIVLQSGHGARLGSNFPQYCLWWDDTLYPGGRSGYTFDPNAEEIIVTARSTDTLTVTRAGSPSTHNTGGSTYVINCGVTKSFLSQLQSGLFPSLLAADLTASRLVTSGTGGRLQSDNFRVDSTSGFLGIGLTGAPDARLVVRHNWDAATTTIGSDHEVARFVSTTVGAGTVSTPHVGVSVGVTDNSPTEKTITNAANNGSGLIRITATGHGYSTNDAIGVYNVGGTTEANGAWDVTVIDANTFDLQGSTFSNAYTSGGTATNRAQLVGVKVSVTPSLARSQAGTGTAFNDDANGVTVTNTGSAKGTDAFYVGNGTIGGGAVEWTNAFATDADSNYFFRSIGKAYTAGIDLESATVDTGVPMLTLGAGHNVKLDTATGTKWATSTSQKQAWWNATPITQPTSTSELKDGVLGALGLMASGGAAPLDLDGGALTAGSATISGAIVNDTTTLVTDPTNNRVGIGTASPDVPFQQEGTNAFASYTALDGNSRRSSVHFSNTLTDDTFTSPMFVANNDVLINFSTGPGSKAINLQQAQAAVTSGSTSLSSLTLRGVVPSITYSGTSTLGTALANSGTITNSSSGTITTARGAQGTVTNSSTGTITTAEGVAATVSNTNASGTISDASILRVTLSNSGTVTNTVGVNVGDISAGTQTNRPLAFLASDTGASSAFNHNVIIGGGTDPATVGAIVRATTEATNTVRIMDGTAPAGALNGGSGVDLYSTSGELRVMDDAGNATLLSPHDDDTGEWILFTQNTVTGKVLRVDMESLIKKLDAMVGGGYVTEFIDKDYRNTTGAAQGRVLFARMPWAPYVSPVAQVH